ncbi:unnamed protein product [Didymodactylos carnosus]|uniref:Uncharacterized protein n=1 Tax=Didymodactylos carnosus TaxID=1234261 RepID=A0A816BNG3_9BILA|nr:unnamed protein product [Didymodactylos carnosus]CAF1612153.1 unnamed protein product [Didymodactylos carnosus]CAF4095399.1 unnamed protein product [Didymodactylos carnosus]CAF4495792.1 unnamed protein product [Didymodactylos carnosus]
MTRMSAPDQRENNSTVLFRSLYELNMEVKYYGEMWSNEEIYVFKYILLHAPYLHTLKMNYLILVSITNKFSVDVELYNRIKCLELYKVHYRQWSRNVNFIENFAKFFPRLTKLHLYPSTLCYPVEQFIPVVNQLIEHLPYLSMLYIQRFYEYNPNNNQKFSPPHGEKLLEELILNDSDCLKNRQYLIASYYRSLIIWL